MDERKELYKEREWECIEDREYVIEWDNRDASRSLQSKAVFEDPLLTWIEWDFVSQDYNSHHLSSLLNWWFQFHILASFHLSYQIWQTQGSERWSQGQNLIEGTTHRPYISFGIITQSLHNLRCYIKRCTHSSLSHVLSELEDSGNAKVTHFDISLLFMNELTKIHFIQKQVLRLDITMNHLLLMEIV